MTAKVIRDARLMSAHLDPDGLGAIQSVEPKVEPTPDWEGPTEPLPDSAPAEAEQSGESPDGEV
jgi:hypothetical protein